MTLDEAIKHCEEVAHEKRMESNECISVNDLENAEACYDCGEYHKQLAEWLTELKQCREAEISKPQKLIDSENVIVWLNAQIEKVQVGWLHDYGFPTNVIAALTDVKQFVKNLPIIEPKVRHGKGCSYCKGRAYSKKPLTVITRSLKRVETVFNFCPCCGRSMIKDAGTD